MSALPQMAALRGGMLRHEFAVIIHEDAQMAQDGQDRRAQPQDEPERFPNNVPRNFGDAVRPLAE